MYKREFTVSEMQVSILYSMIKMTSRVGPEMSMGWVDPRVGLGWVGSRFLAFW